MNLFSHGVGLEGVKGRESHSESKNLGLVDIYLGVSHTIIKNCIARGKSRVRFLRV